MTLPLSILRCDLKHLKSDAYNIYYHQSSHSDLCHPGHVHKQFDPFLLSKNLASTATRKVATGHYIDPSMSTYKHNMNQWNALRDLSFTYPAYTC